MGKLGKKARKFAKKNLQSVLRQKRKTKALFKKRYSSNNEHNIVENQAEKTTQLANGRNTDGEDTVNTSLDALFIEDDNDMVSDASDSDGFLSEDSSSSHFVESGDGHFEENNNISNFTVHSRKMQEELATEEKKLNKLKKKDPEFAKFLESYDGKRFQNGEMYSDEDETSNHGMQLDDERYASTTKGKLLTSSVINLWNQLVTEEHSESALISLLNAYRAACHLGSEPAGLSDTASCPRIQNSDTFCSIYMFMLREADNIFRGLLKVPSSNCKKETILELKNNSKWKKLKPLVKSYLRSTLFLLKNVTNSEILAFSLTRLRSSIIFFAAFPSLLGRLIKIIVPLWATAEGALSSCSFLIIRDVASLFSSNFFDTCLIKTYKAYIDRCRNLEAVDSRHIEFLRNSFVELCSLDVQKSCSKALVSIRQLGNILQRALQKEKKEEVKRICSWQYAKCIDIWVLFISANVRDHDIQPLFYMATQVINGVVYLFPGPRYFPLRVKCIQWLNKLSSSSGIFIPVTSLVLDILEYKISRDGGKRGKAIDSASLIKLPKYWLKSQSFQVECVHSAIELLAVHFVQWSYHISFPDLATIPLIRLRKFHKKTTNESLQRVVKRLIDQVEQNVEFVQKRRDEVAFSPKDHQSVDVFLQFEKSSKNSPFLQYYRSVIDKAAAKNMHLNEKSLLEQKKLKRKRGKLPNKNKSDGNVHSDAERIHSVTDGEVDSKRKKRRALKV